mmetsp:Transcript_4453/g.4217  ORF Transcript_4453/g.4217 Transcript_4453/m.4217 type:complete len:796 (-) Transcript_4453:22-2409(-)
MIEAHRHHLSVENKSPLLSPRRLVLSFLISLIFLSSSNAFLPNSLSRSCQATFNDKQIRVQSSCLKTLSSWTPQPLRPTGDSRVSSLTIHTILAAQTSDVEDDSTSTDTVQNNNAKSISWQEQASKFVEMATPYYRESQSGRWLFAGMIALTLLNSGVSVAFSYIGKDFWNALSERDQTQFYQMLFKYAAALLVGAPVKVLYAYQREQLANNWREWMTDRTLQIYQSNRAYYNLERQSDIDNPDQRITEDVRSFTAFSLTLFLAILTSTIDLFSFSAILYSIQPQLFLAIFAYAGFGTFTTTVLGKSLIPLNYEKLQKEANFRYSLVRLRDNAESIAFYAGEDLEGKEISKRLDKVISNRKDINKAERNLEFFTTCYNYFVQILPVAVVAPQYFAATIPLGVVSQSSGAFNHILSDLSVIVNRFEQLSTFSAAIDRLSQFLVEMREADDSRDNTSPLLSLPNVTYVNGDTGEYSFNEPELTISLDTATSDYKGNINNILVSDPGDEYSKIDLVKMEPLSDAHMSDASLPKRSNVLTFTNLTLITPDRKRTLLEDLNLDVKDGQHLLIVGNSGAGKSSLLRAIAGLWTAGSGKIERPSEQDVYFLPQRPYCALGSLKDQLLYPSLSNDTDVTYPEGHRLSKAHLLREFYTDEDLLDILDTVDLPELANRAGDGDPIKGLYAKDIDWSNTLSLGEQQRVAFGRLMINRPRFVILDEATSALDTVAEAKMYGLLQTMAKQTISKNNISRPGLTYVSVGHRPSLIAFHDVKLRLLGGRNSTVTEIERSAVDISVAMSNM